MSILGSAFGRALSGAGGAAAEVANRYIDANLQKQRDEALSALRRGDAVFAEEYAQSKPVQDRRNTNAATATRTAATTQDDIELGRLTNEPLIEAGRRKVAGDAAAAARITNDQAIADANNPELLSARGKVKLADPEVAARIAASRAAIASAGANAGLTRAQTEAVNLTIADKKKLDGLYDQAGTILSDPKLDDAKRAQELAKVERQITLMKSKSGTTTRDPELDTETITEKVVDDQGNERTVQRKVVRRPGAGGQAAEEVDPIKAAMDAARAAAAAKKKPSASSTAKTEPAAGQMEETKNPQGKTMYRVRGSQQWYPSKVEAIAALGRNRPSTDAGGLDQGF